MSLGYLPVKTRQGVFANEDSIVNIHGTQYAFINGLRGPKNTYDRGFHKQFYVPNIGTVRHQKEQILELENSSWTPGPKVTKVSRDAVEAMHTVQKEKANQYYFDELDKNNLFPRSGRPVRMTRTLATHSNGDGTYNMFSQPGYIRAQQNNDGLGDVPGVVYKEDSKLPTRANAPTEKVILGSRTVMQQTDTFNNLSTETGAIGNVPRTPYPGFDQQQTSVSDIPVKDLRTMDTQTEHEIDRDVLDALFSNDVKFQIYLIS
ncbi:hypothetical protein DFS34DRAFT_591009 [Phlyctochytrium arcticum]|nr:hypothetical protein DFS34DRAFT_591009 [Phlyctochytrium arcticum]